MDAGHSAFAQASDDATQFATTGRESNEGIIVAFYGFRRHTDVTCDSK